MSIKNLFGNSSKNGPSNKDNTIIPLTSLSGSVLSSSSESERQMSAKRAFEQRIIPPVDFSIPKNFARFGSAEEYYTNAIYHIYSSYPYDGSNAEKKEWHNSSSDLENYIFNFEYPRTTGFANFAPGNDAWGTLQGSKVNTFGLSDTKEFIQVVGGPHTSTRRPGDPIEGGIQEGTFKDGFANIWEPSTNRKSNLQLDFDKGVCVEFWLKKDADVTTTKTEKEVIFDIWNGDSGETTYGRCIVYSEGGTIKAQVSSGTSDFSIQSDGSDTDGKWHHHSFVWKNSSSALECEYYKDGVYVKKATHSGLMSEITGALKANLGAARRPGLTRAQVNALSVSESIDGYGKLSGSIDEFRYWTKHRNARQIGRNFWTAVNGATNNDLSNDQSLGLYLKFNEGNTGDATLDSVVLDYSGRISNGTWTVDGTNTFVGSVYRNLGSAINAASEYATTSFSGSEFRDPILRQSHPDVVSYKSEKILSASYHDSTNGTMIYNTLPSWVTEQDLREDGELKKLCQIMASYLDTVYIQIQTLPTIKHSKYVEDVTGSKPYPFMKHMLSSVGFRAPDLFTETKTIHEFLDRDEEILFEESLTEVKNLIYRNIYNNISYIYKTKGTEKSFRNLIRCFGIDDEIYKLNSYGQNQVFEFKNRYQNISVKRNYVDFYESTWPAPTSYNKTNATVYLVGDAIPGIATGSGHAFTYECEMRFPRKIRSDEDKYVPYDDVSGSIFGIKTVPTSGSYTEDSQLLNVWFVKQGDDVAHAPPGESEDVVFYAQLSDGTTVSSSIYKSVYENEEWFLAVTVDQPKNNTLGVHKDSSESGESGLLTFTGINTAGDYVVDNFTLTASVSNNMLNQFLTSSKRPWLGAKKLNFLAANSTQQITDVKIGALRGWLGALSYDELVAHARDARNYGRLRPLRSSFLLQSGSNQVHIPMSETCIFNWAFDDVSTANVSGQFAVKDASSGSALTSLYSGTELNLDNLLSRKFEGQGEGFPPSAHAVDRTYVISAKHLPAEVVVSSDQVNILTKDDINFTRNTRPQNIVMRLEKSMYQVISEDMLNMFAGIEEFNNLVGESVNKYRQQYKGMELLRRVYFDKVGNTPNIDKFLDYYKWMDDSLAQMLRQVLPMSADVSEDVGNVVESHVLERNKYLHKFPTMEFKQDDPEGAIRGIEELKYPWKFGHAAVVGKNKFWSRERQNHSDSNRESIRKAIVTETSGTSPTLSGSTGAYSGDEYARRSMLRTYEIVVDDPTTVIGSEKDRSRQIDGPSRAWNQSADSRRNFGFHRGLLKFGDSNTYIELDVHQSPDFELINPDKVEEKDVSLTKQDMVNTRARIYSDGNYYSGSSTSTLRSTDILPFTIHNSPELSGGYRSAYWKLGTSSVSFNNMHEDRSGDRRIAPLQGPFTEKHVGGLQYRHQDLNINAQDGGGLDAGNDIRSRAEGWEIVDPGSSGFVFSSLLKNTNTGYDNEDFEFGFMGAGSTPAGWARQTAWTNTLNGPTPTANTGPSAAHSNNYYAYAEATSVAAGTSQFLRTLTIDGKEAAAGNFSGSFYYHMYGADQGTLQVQASTDIGNTFHGVWNTLEVNWDGTLSTIIAGQQQLSSSAPWKLATFDLSDYAGKEFYIRFQWTKGLSNLGDCAIDLLTINQADFGEFTLRDANYFTKHRARGVLYREEGAKRPVNIKNIRQLTSSAVQSGVQHSTTIIGNYSKNYELVQTADSLVNNFHLKKTVDTPFSEQAPAGYVVEDNIRTGLTSSFITPIVYTMVDGTIDSAYGTDINTGIGNYDVVYPIHSLPKHPNDKATGHHNWLILSQTTVPERSLHSNKSIIVNRFNAPGDSFTSRRASLDFESEQYSPNNALPWRNYRVKRVFNSGSAERFDGVSYISVDIDSPIAVAASTALLVTDGDATATMNEKESITLISTDGTTKKYVVVDGDNTSVATGTILEASSDTGTSTAGSDNAGGIAVNVDIGSSPETQNEFLVQLKAAIEHENGHNGKIIVSAVPGAANGSQGITLTQAVKGTAGNTAVTEDITDLAVGRGISSAFTGGVEDYATATLSGSALSASYQHKTYKNPLTIPSLSTSTEHHLWTTKAGNFQGDQSGTPVKPYLQCAPTLLGPIAGAQSFSVSCWLALGRTTGTQPIISHNDTNSNSDKGRWDMSITNGGYLSVGIYDKDSDNLKYYQALNDPLTVRTWYHVGFTWNLESQSLKLFINGAQKPATKTTDGTITSLWNSNRPDAGADENLMIGAAMTNGTRSNSLRLSGSLVDLAFWGRTLTDAEMLETYSPKTYLPFVEGSAGPADLTKHSATKNGGRDSLLGYWRFGDGQYYSESDTALGLVKTGEVYNQAPVSLNRYPSSEVFATMQLFDQDGGPFSITPLSFPSFLPTASFYSMSTKKRHDNRFVSHQIPRTSRQYSWITASLASHEYTKNNVSLGFAEESAYENLDGEYVLSVKDKSNSVAWTPQLDNGEYLYSGSGGSTYYVFGADETSFPLTNVAPSSSEGSSSAGPFSMHNSPSLWRFDNPIITGINNPTGSSNPASIPVDSVGLNTIIYDPIIEEPISFTNLFDIADEGDDVGDIRLGLGRDTLRNERSNNEGHTNTLGIPRLIEYSRGNIPTFYTASLGTVVSGALVTGIQYSNFALALGYMNLNYDEEADYATGRIGLMKYFTVPSGNYAPETVHWADPVGFMFRTGDSDKGYGTLRGLPYIIGGSGQEDLFNALMTKRNGTYGYPSWKQVRTGEHPVVRYLNKNNIHSIYFEQKVMKDTRGSDALFSEGLSRFINITQSAISSRYKPLTTLVDVGGQQIALKHSYANNLCGMASAFLNRYYGYDNNSEQAHEQLYSLYAIPENLVSSPIRAFLKLKYKEKVFPRDRNVYQKRIRQRLFYDEIEPGWRARGFDKWDSEKFWSDDPNSRTKSRHLHYNVRQRGEPWVPSESGFAADFDAQISSDRYTVGFYGHPQDWIQHHAHRTTAIFAESGSSTTAFSNTRIGGITGALSPFDNYWAHDMLVGRNTPWSMGKARERMNNMYAMNEQDGDGMHGIDPTSNRAQTFLKTFDGDATVTAAEKAHLTLIDTNGVKKRYVIVNGASTSVATGTVLSVGDDTGAGTAGSDEDGGIAVNVNLSTATNYDLLVELKTAINHANGHDHEVGISGSQPPSAAGNGKQFIQLMQVTGGLAGNTSVSHTLDAFTIKHFGEYDTDGAPDEGDHMEGLWLYPYQGTTSIESVSGSYPWLPHQQEQLSTWVCDISENVDGSKVSGSMGVWSTNVSASTGFNDGAASLVFTSSAPAQIPSASFGSLIHPSVYTPSDWRRDDLFDGASQRNEGGHYIFNYQPACGYLWDSQMIEKPLINMYRAETLLSTEMKPSTVHDVRGRGAFFSTLEEWAEDVMRIGQDYSILPEFKISDHIDHYVKNRQGNFLSLNRSYLSIKGTETSSSAESRTDTIDFQFYRDYSNSDFMQHFEYLVDNHNTIADVSRISLTCRAVKKLLPYNGFYPSTRVVQLAQIFSSSYDGFLSGSSMTASYGLEGAPRKKDSNGTANNANFKLMRDHAAVYPNFLQSLGTGSEPSRTHDGDPFYAQRLNCFWQPLISPGVLLNSIKSGIAVDYPVYRTFELDYSNVGAIGARTLKTIGKHEPSHASATNDDHSSNADHHPLGPGPDGLNPSGSVIMPFAPSLRIPFEALLDQSTFMPKSPEQLGSTQRSGQEVSAGTTNSLDSSVVLSKADLYSSSLSLNHAWHVNNLTYATSYAYAGAEASNIQIDTIRALWGGDSVPMFEMAAHNFTAEVPTFFLAGNGALTTFASQTEQKIKPMRSGSAYYMDVSLFKSDNLVTTEGPRKSYLFGIKKNPNLEDLTVAAGATTRVSGSDLVFAGSRRGVLYGPAISGGVAHNIDDAMIGNHKSAISCSMLHQDPAYAPWTPPYFYGTSVARIKFQPHEAYIMSEGESRKFTFEEIFAGAEVEYFNENYMAQNETTHETTRFTNIGEGEITQPTLKEAWMQNSASLNIFRLTRRPTISVDPLTGKETQVSSTSGEDDLIWTISTKWECPVLDFSLGHQDSGSYVFYRDNNNARVDRHGVSSYRKEYTSKYSTAGSSGSMDASGDLKNYGWLLGSGSCRALWNTYGEIPQGSQGVFLGLRESFPDELYKHGGADRGGAARSLPLGATGSLLQVCGFENAKEKIGNIAEEREISELVVAIPFIDRPTEEMRESKQVVWNNDFQRYFFRIQSMSYALQSMHKAQTGNALPANIIFDGAPAVVDTSVTDLTQKIKDYVFPPRLDFVKYPDVVKPFVAYTFEFNSTLDQEDLSDIWQGVMPKLSLRAEKESVSVSHTNSPWEFFGGKKMPDKVRWMVFKVKKRAKTNYYELIQDAESDRRFKFNFDLSSKSKKTPQQTYNWPYDFFSLVELAQLESEIVIDAKKNE